MSDLRDKFQQLYNLQLANLKYSPWIKKTPLPERIKELGKEVEELSLKVHCNKIDGLTEEIGDVIWDSLGILAKISEQYGVKPEVVLEQAYQKFIRRKPFLLDGREVTGQEEKDLWEKVKKLEKLGCYAKK